MSTAIEYGTSLAGSKPEEKMPNQMTRDQIKAAYSALSDDDKRKAVELKRQGASPEWALKQVQSAKDQQSAFDQAQEPSTGMKVAAGAEGLANGLSFGVVPALSALLEKAGVDKAHLAGPDIEAAQQMAPGAYGAGDALGTVAQLLLGAGEAAGAKSLEEIPAALKAALKGGGRAALDLATGKAGKAVEAASESHNMLGAALKAGKALMPAAEQTTKAAAPAAADLFAASQGATALPAGLGFVDEAAAAAPAVVDAAPAVSKAAALKAAIKAALKQAAAHGATGMVADADEAD